MEMIIAMSIITIVFASILPLFGQIRNSWDSKQVAAETLQNGRILIDHLNRNLSKAVIITAISDSSETNGYIEYEDNDTENIRYDVNSTTNYVEFGPVNNLSDLAGPVSQLQFTCYDACDLDNHLSPVTDANIIRVVKVETTVTGSASPGQDKTFTAWAYLRTNGQNEGNWENQDIGNVGETGSASCASYDWTVEGSGADIMWNTDEFHFVYQPLSNDGQIIARLVSLEDTGDYTKAGLMIRETLNGNSRYAGILVTPDNGIFFQNRTITGGYTNFNSPGYSAQAPRWLKLTRSNNTFTGYVSSDGSVWTQVGSDVSIYMGTGDIYIGMAVCSYNDGVLCTAEFDNISFNTITYETFEEQKVSSDDTSITISTPATDEGDLLIAAVATDEDTSSSLDSPGGEGWTEIDIDDYSSEVTLGAWWKLAEASESATHQFTWTGGQQAYGWIMRFTGHDSSDPIDIFSTDGDSDSNPTSPAVTTTVGNSMIVRLGAFDDDDITEDEPGLSDHTVITMDESSNTSGMVEILGSWTSGLTHTAEVDSNRLLILTAHVEENGVIDLSSVTYGGQSMTKVIDEIAGTTYRSYVVAYILNEVGISASTSNTFVPNWSAMPDNVSYSSVFLSNINQTTPIGATADNGTASAFPNPITTTALSTAEGDMVINAATCGNTGNYTVNNGFTEAIELDMTTSTGVAGYKPATGANETPSVIHSGPNRQVIIGLVAQSAGEGPGGTVSGGAGYARQSSSGSSGTSTFSLGSANEAQTLTIAIAPDDNTSGYYGEIRP